MNTTKKIWKGKFALSYDESEHQEWFPFEIQADYLAGNFSGCITEQPFSTFTNEPISVKGFIEHELISFVKTYPFKYEENEHGTVYIDTSQKGHEVIYEGHWNNELGKWEGQWEIEIQEESDLLIPGKFNQLLIIGPWEMKLV